MKFRTAVRRTTELASYYKIQLNALSSAHQNSISSSDPNRITGSVNIDAASQAAYPNENRWDYALGYRISTKDDKAFFVEFHRAKVDQVPRVVRKKEWLESWMKGKSVANLRQRKFVWVSAGGIKIPPNSPHRRILNTHGLHLVRRLKLG